MPFHYTYRLTAQNPIDDRIEYIGVRSCECDPANDTAYMSSSQEVKALIKSGMVFVKEIIATWPSRKAAVAHEVSLHVEHDVARSGRFFNKANQLVAGFDTSGTQMSAAFRARRSEIAKAQSTTDEMRELKRVQFFTNNPMHNKEVVAKVTEKVSGSNNGMHHSNGRKHPMLGKSHSSQSLARMREGNANPISRHLKAVAKMGDKNPAKRDDVKAKIARVKELKSLFCKEFGITKPGRQFCNVDKVAFTKWLNSNSAKVA